MFCAGRSEEHAAGAEAHVCVVGLMPGMSPRPTARMSFSAGCEAAAGLETRSTADLEIGATFCMALPSAWRCLLAGAAFWRLLRAYLSSLPSGSASAPLGRSLGSGLMTTPWVYTTPSTVRLTR